MNTSQNGSYRWMIYKEGDSWIGVALEFNIVVTGDDPRVVEIELNEAVVGYLESAKKLEKGFRPTQVSALLNQKTEEEYENIWDKAQSSITEKVKNKTAFSFDLYKAGIASLAYA